MKFIKSVPPVYCGDNADWVKVNGSTVFITDEARARHGNIQCAFTGQLKVKASSTHIYGLSVHSPASHIALRLGYTIPLKSY